MMRSFERDGAARVYWLTLPAATTLDWNHIYRSVNLALRTAARREGKGVRLIDMGAIFTPRGRFQQTIVRGGRRISVRQSDGIHLNVAGARIAARVVVRRMRRDRPVPVRLTLALAAAFVLAQAAAAQGAVLVVGDSLVVGTAPYLRPQLPTVRDQRRPHRAAQHRGGERAAVEVLGSGRGGVRRGRERRPRPALAAVERPRRRPLDRRRPLPRSSPR